MIRFLLFSAVSACLFVAQGSWYWPFGKSEDEPPRLSKLIEPASLLIDEASDLAGEGKVSDAVEKYQAAIVELDRIAAENPDRIETPEFSTLKTKRAFIEAAIDSLLFRQARENARQVAVSDTSRLRRRLGRERNPKKSREELLKLFERGDFAQIDKQIQEYAEDLPEDELVQSLYAMRLTMQYQEGQIELKTMTDEEARDELEHRLRGKLDKAQKILEALVKKNEQKAEGVRDATVCYNLALVILEQDPDDKDAAREVYEKGCSWGGARDAELEARLK